MSMPKFVAQTLQQRILSGVYAPGEVLPGQRELAGQLGVSRGALREAVSVLMTLGFLRSIPGKGTFVAHRGQHDAGLATRSAEQTVQLRYIIEPSAAALAARTTGPAAAKQFRDMQVRALKTRYYATTSSTQPVATSHSIRQSPPIPATTSARKYPIRSRIASVKASAFRSPIHHA